MAWYPDDDHDSIDVADEARVGLIEPKSEITTRHSTKQRHSWISKSFLSIMLIASNMAWAGFCLMLWQKLHILSSPALASHNEFETDFGISTSTI